jgi:hypothetical protein
LFTAWTGGRLLAWGDARDATATHVPGFSFDPKANHWSSLPGLPFQSPDLAAAWSGDQLLIWSGLEGAVFDPVGGSS